MGELNQASERYLKHHGLTPESVAYIDGVVDKFEWFIDIALQRALEELAVPCEVIEIKKRPEGRSLYSVDYPG